MAIKAFKDYETTRAYSDAQMLPRGGYVCKIIGARVEDGRFGQQIVIAFDIEEGEFAGYYQRRFDENTREDKKWPGVYYLSVPLDDGTEKDGWTKRRFKTFVEALEDSNEGYRFDWDEQKFKGKRVGFAVNYREFEANGSVHTAPNVASAYSVSAVREGKYKVPADRLLKDRQAAPSPGGYTQVETEDIPF